MNLQNIDIAIYSGNNTQWTVVLLPLKQLINDKSKYSLVYPCGLLSSSVSLEKVEKVKNILDMQKHVLLSSDYNEFSQERRDHTNKL